MPEYKEQVFFHHLTEKDQNTSILLENGSIGFEVNWNPTVQPYFTQWKNTRQGMYVSGIEPGNCIPEGQNRARSSGRLQMLAPGEEVRTSVHLSVLEGADVIGQAKQEIEDLRQSGTPSAGIFSDFS